MIILALDLSTKNLGWAVMVRGALIGHGETALTGLLDARINEACATVGKLLAGRHYDALAFEQPFVGQNRLTAIELAQITGAMCGVAHNWGLRVIRVAPCEAKAAATGNGSADKAAVQRMVKAEFWLEKVGEHEADAIAVAVAAAGKIRVEEMVGS